MQSETPQPAAGGDPRAQGRILVSVVPLACGALQKYFRTEVSSYQPKVMFDPAGLPVKPDGRR